MAGSFYDCVEKSPRAWGLLVLKGLLEIEVVEIYGGPDLIVGLRN